MELSCECGNESMFLERIMVDFTVDGEGNREDKIWESTEYVCCECNRPAEVCE